MKEIKTPPERGRANTAAPTVHHVDKMNNGAFIGHVGSTHNQTTGLTPITVGELVSLIRTPDRVEPCPADNEASRALKGTLSFIWPGGTSRAGAPTQLGYLWADIDSGNRTAEWVAQKLQALDVEVFAMHTTASSRPDNRKWRVFIPLARPIEVELWKALQTTLAEFLGGDHAALKPTQIMYLPVQTPGYEYRISDRVVTAFNALLHDGTPNAGLTLVRLAVESMARDQRENKLREAAKAAKSAKVAGAVSVVDEFKRQHSIDDVLEKYGYEVRDRRVFDPDGANVGYVAKDDPNRVFVLDTNSPLYATNEAGDALPVDGWEVEVRLKYDSNAGKAIADWSRRLVLDDGTTIHDHNTTARFTAIHEFKPGGLLIPLAELKNAPMASLVKGLIGLDSLVSIIGEPGSYKSFVVLDMALCIASGRDYHGRPVEQGLVVFALGEGHGGFKKRAEAWALHNQTDIPKDFYVTQRPLMLAGDDQTDVVAFINEIRQIGVPKLVVVDTLARNYGADENSTQDMTRFVTRCDEIRTAFGCCVLVVHHTSKADKTQGRGSSVWRGALDLEFVTRRENGLPVIDLICSKSKDAEPSSLSFRAKKVTLPVDWATDDGEAVTSLVLEEVTEGGPSASVNPFKGYVADVYRVLEEIDPFGLSGSCTLDHLKDKVAERWEGLKPDAVRKRLKRSLDEMAKAGRVRLTGDRVEFVGVSHE